MSTFVDLFFFIFLIRWFFVVGVDEGSEREGVGVWIESEMNGSAFDPSSK